MALLPLPRKFVNLQFQPGPALTAFLINSKPIKFQNDVTYQTNLSILSG